METKYIFLDIDGTLVDFQGKLADSALEALKAAKANGHKLFVCTGRQRSQIYPWLLEKITFDGAVCSSGAYVMADGECIARHCFSKEYMAFLARYFTSLHAPYCVQTEHTLMLEKWCADAIVAHYLADGIDRGKINSLFGMTTVVESASELTSAESSYITERPRGSARLPPTSGSASASCATASATWATAAARLRTADTQRPPVWRRYCAASMRRGARR